MKFLDYLPYVLIVYGIIGAIVCFSNLSTVASLGGLQAPVEAEFKSVSQTLDHASDAAARAAASIREGKSALHSGSEVVEQAADAFGAISDVAGFEVLGWRPFGTAGPYFKQLDGNLEKLAIELVKTGDAMEGNAADMELIADDLMDVSNNFDMIARKFTSDGGGSLKKLFTSLLIYAALLHLMFALTGLLLLKK